MAQVERSGGLPRGTHSAVVAAGNGLGPVLVEKLAAPFPQRG